MQFFVYFDRATNGLRLWDYIPDSNQGDCDLDKPDEARRVVEFGSQSVELDSEVSELVVALAVLIDSSRDEDRLKSLLDSVFHAGLKFGVEHGAEIKARKIQL